MLCQLVDASLDALGIRSWNGRKCFSRLASDLDAVDQGRFNSALTSSQGIAPCKRTSSRAAAAAATSSASSNRCNASSASRETSAAKGVPGRLRVRRSAAKIDACRATGYNIAEGHARKLVKIGDRGYSRYLRRASDRRSPSNAPKGVARKGCSLARSAKGRRRSERSSYSPRQPIGDARRRSSQSIQHSHQRSIPYLLCVGKW